MISFNEAQSLLRATAKPLPEERRPVDEAFGLVLAQDVHAKQPHPRFHNSAVDGYAVAFNPALNEYKVVGEVAAGDAGIPHVAPGACVRIFTGAAMPAGTDTSVMQERVERIGNSIRITDSALRLGANVRLQGEEVKDGDLLLEKGTFLNAAAIGTLISCGADCVSVYPKPRVSILITGNEFTIASNPEAGKIFNSNGPMLQAAIGHSAQVVHVAQIVDDPNALKAACKAALAISDVVITTGGVSVGDHDHVPSTWVALGVDVVFHKVAQKPGKPMFYGRSGHKHIFGLPGNPRAVLIGYWIHLLPLLGTMQGNDAFIKQSIECTLGMSVELKGTRTEMLAVHVKGGKVFVAVNQNSHMLASLVNADGIAIFPPHQRLLKAGESVTVYPIPA